MLLPATTTYCLDTDCPRWVRLQASKGRHNRYPPRGPFATLCVHMISQMPLGDYVHTKGAPIPAWLTAPIDPFKQHAMRRAHPKPAAPPRPNQNGGRHTVVVPVPNWMNVRNRKAPMPQPGRLQSPINKHKPGLPVARRDPRLPPHIQEALNEVLAEEKAKLKEELRKQIRVSFNGLPHNPPQRNGPHHPGPRVSKAPKPSAPPVTTLTSMFDEIERRAFFDKAYEQKAARERTSIKHIDITDDGPSLLRRPEKRPEKPPSPPPALPIVREVPQEQRDVFDNLFGDDDDEDFNEGEDDIAKYFK